MLKKLIIIITLLISANSFAENNKIENINATHKNIQWLEQQIQKEQAPERLEKLKKQLERAENTLMDLATDTSFYSFRKEKEEAKPNILGEIEEILNPVISNLKRISSRPRKMEKLKDRIISLQEKADTINTGLNNVKKLMKNKEAAHLLVALTDIENKLQKLKQNTDLRKNLLEQQLNKLSNESGTVIDTVRNIISDVFKTKGKNIFLALLTTILAFILFQQLKKLIFRKNRFSQRFFYLKKTISALYGLIAVSFSILCGIFCLYLLNDWFLFTLSLLLIVGILWSTKQFIPKMIKQIRLVLNLGSIRENERIVWNGCPWLIKKIGFRCLLENKELEGGILKLSIDKFYDLYSREVVKDEPWFPTKKNDWVILDDKTFGKVLIQTPEQVVLELFGKTKKYYSLSAFIDLKPENLSSGFTVSTLLGLDYSLQKDIFNIIDIFKKEFTFTEFTHDNILIEFKEAASHSLNLFVRINFSGEMAEFFYKIQRLMQAKLVEICNKHNFDIPFEQLTVHVKN